MPFRLDETLLRERDGTQAGTYKHGHAAFVSLLSLQKHTTSIKDNLENIENKSLLYVSSPCVVLGGVSSLFVFSSLSLFNYSLLFLP